MTLAVHDSNLSLIPVLTCSQVCLPFHVLLFSVDVNEWYTARVGALTILRRQVLPLTRPPV